MSNGRKMKIGTGRVEGLGVDDLLWNEPYLVLRTALFAPQYGLFWFISFAYRALSKKEFVYISES